MWSWAYTILWLLPSKILFWVLHETGKVSLQSYRSNKTLMLPVDARILLHACNSWDHIYHMAHNMLFMLAINTGMWNISTGDPYN
jgi:hypothetical protein